MGPDVSVGASPIRILIFQPYAQREGHFAMYTTYTCQALAELGHDVTLVTTRLDTKPYLSGEAKFRRIEAGQSRLLQFQKRGTLLEGLVRGLSIIWDNSRVLFRLLRIARTDRFDVVHFFDYEPLSTAALLRLFSRRGGRRLPPLFLVLHAPDTSLQGHANPLYKLYGRLARPLLKRIVTGYVTAITVHGAWQPGELEGLLGLAAGKPSLIPVSHGAILHGQPPSRDEARRILGLPYSGIVFLSFGMLRKDKGIDILIEAMGRVKGDCKLLIAGLPFDWTEEAVREMIRAHGCESRIVADLRYIPQDRIIYYFSAADAVVYPYRAGHMGAVGSLNTVLAFGKPVIASEVRELAVLFRESHTGILTEPENAESLRRGIEQFLSLTPLEREIMAENGRRLAADDSWTAVAKRFSEIYQAYSSSIQ